MKQTTKAGRILWAVDPLAQDRELERKVGETLRAFTRRNAFSVEPVHVLLPEGARLTREAIFARDFRPEADRVLEAWLGDLGSRGVETPRLLLAAQSSAASVVDAIVEHARRSRAAVIAIATRAKGPLARLLFGSFARDLFLKSRVPVLVVGPRAAAPEEIRTILFPTDFSTEALRGLRSLLPAARALGAEVLLYHDVECWKPYTKESAPSRRRYEELIDREIIESGKRASRWARELGRVSGVRFRFVVNESNRPLTDSIVYAAKKERADLIAVASGSGRFEAALLGSVAKDIMRKAPVPVWLMRPRVPEGRLHRVTEPRRRG